MLAYAPGNDEQVATRAGVKWSTLRGQLLPRSKKGPDPGILIDLARGLGLPEQFALDGWSAVPGWTPNDAYQRAIALTSPDEDGVEGLPDPPVEAGESQEGRQLQELSEPNDEDRAEEGTA